MNLLPKLDTSWMGKPDPVRLALDRLGYYDHRIVAASYIVGKAKHFDILYQRHGIGHVMVVYKEAKGAVEVLKVYEATYNA